MASNPVRKDFVTLVAEEVTAGIHRGLDYWLGRIELEAVDGRLTPGERLSAIERILGEYKQIVHLQPGCARV
jgi:hypothetical protein